MKTFKSITTVKGMQEPFVDWYDGETEADARKVWDEDCHRYGLPMDKTTVVFIAEENVIACDALAAIIRLAKAENLTPSTRLKIIQSTAENAAKKLIV